MEDNGPRPGPHSSAAADRSKKRQSRKYRGLTCANCRAKKVRCEGSQPTCKTCEIYHVDCHYDKPPPLSQVMAMAKRLQEAEEMIQRLQGSDTPAERPETSVPFADNAPRAPPTFANEDLSSEIPLPAVVPGPSTERDVFEGSPNTRQHHPRDTQDSSPSALAGTGTSQDALAIELSVDEHGKICYYGPTSAVHEPLGLASPSTNSISRGESSKRADVRTYLVSRARESAIWEEFALGNASLQLGLPRQVMAKLLHLHWTWVAPMFMWVYRPAFMRDMTTGGRYYSELLLLVLCAHASKYSDNNNAQLLFSRVRVLLGDEIQKPSSIPTTQALLQLSARELAQGNISQAWLYSGMAFRMSADLGLQHNGPDIADLKGLDPVDLEIRKRLFWSCYFWDKAISLYTGRLPAVTELPKSPIDFMDDSAESETWSPYFQDSSTLTRLAPSQYPIMQSHAVSCFANSCKLSVIINDIIIQLYSKRSKAITESSLNGITARLDNWRVASPLHLRCNPEALPTICPPPHVISQNLLYFTTVILAHRPFWAAAAYYQVCMAAALSMEKILLLLESSFGFENITYLMGYCIYTGASAVLEDAKNNDGATHPTMQTFLRALNRGMAKCPLLERSLHIIIKGLKRAPVYRAPPDQSLSDNAATTTVNSYIPAFPYLDPLSPNDFDMETYLNSMSMDAMASLDCYPELQIDLDEMIQRGAI
ncbi:nitrogen assimilation transcription factor nit-4 [Fusarium heterosporum]|uniref:Nitrogen assimilation transcription factor nit-4 n=1 Tax=Fusarium heterosporum TaxID=42747 RepID=A0A8H5U3N2_FUSHE|nr:nitrogen assimilation transcription factor nit-4 [Fusarium heterosporum]